MNNESISSKQAISMIALFVIGSTLVVGGSTAAKQDSWIAMLISYIAILPFIFVYARILKLYPGKDLFDIIIELFGKVLGKIIIILFTLYAINLGGQILRNFSEFTQVTSMPETPQIVTLLFKGLICIYVVKSGLKTFGKWCLIAIPCIIIVVIFTVILGLKDFTFSNLFPVFVENKSLILTAAFVNFTFPFGEIVLFTTILSALKPKQKIYKVYYCGVSIAVAIIVIGILRNILILGNPLYSDVYYPSFSAIRSIHLGDFLERFEGTIAANTLIAGFVKTSVCLFAASKGISKVFNFDDYKKMAFPCGLLIIATGLIIFKNTMDMFEQIDLYKYYALPFQVAFPILILIMAEIKNRNNISGDIAIKTNVISPSN